MPDLDEDKITPKTDASVCYKDYVWPKAKLMQHMLIIFERSELDFIVGNPGSGKTL
ncbi:hypothetical protein DSAG12_02635 [Promethearchaeum syntrophicum]|uniref:Uncharacterized protein n=1 Tax=Promethearchaeum syntrophicum TaxID=2594042 RepID=A0A5B9DCR7_9ARCH|nr:hypothetical protein [Candidatus Prometheoarchaeum syntrophicum]QEE16805.1 hypothetical protein DSAG12_02635 [Candidatus Prometheoarchaeum syntrophicum]